uniref:Leucine-rich repeat and IQ domain-containing protein 1 n=1 Tax=Serinus canaria TaxID=9135 RepID=A0A8C9MYX3_SERCA
MRSGLACHEVEEQYRRALELEDKKMKKWKAERESQEKQNEEEHARRVQHLEQFEAERIKLDLLHKVMNDIKAICSSLDYLNSSSNEKKGLLSQTELIVKLQLQMEEERKALEEQKAKERQQLAEKQNIAAVKIQARFRAYLVRKKYTPILKQWKCEIRKEQKILEEIEQEVKERVEKLNRQMEENRLNREEERKRQEELERKQYLKQVRRREEYEKKKESLRLEREKQVQIRREEQRKLEQKRAEAVMSENVENNIENIKKNNKAENMKVIREEKEELNKQVEEPKEKHAEMMDETNNWMIPAERNLTPSVLGSEKEHPSQMNNENSYINSVAQVEENYSQTSYLDKVSNGHISKDESLNFGANDMAENKANCICRSPANVQPNANNRQIKDQFSHETMKKTLFLMENATEEVRDTWDSSQDVADSSSKVIFPDDIEKKRINWMKTCKSWSKIYEENQRKQATIRRQLRKSSFSKLPPLSTEKIIHSGPWSTLQQVTTLTLEDLPACSLSTLAECSNLQVLTLRRCGLVALEGLSSCKDLKYINVEENNIQVIDCADLEGLCILILNKNRLSSICGLDGCKNLQNLELSYNRITRIGKKITPICINNIYAVYIQNYTYLNDRFLFHRVLNHEFSGGLESLKNLQQLIVDHNQLISTKGLCEAPTLIHLDCSFNHLAQVEGIENCGLLQVLKLQGNNLQELPRLENHVLLRELCLDDNSISSMRMLALYWLPLLQILLLSQNRLTDLVPLNSFVFLEKLDIKNNCLSDLKDVHTWLSGCHKLKELALSGNPLVQEKNWRSSMLEFLPSLQLLDGEILTNHTLPTTEKVKASELGTFLELCQVQIEENIQLKKKAAELEITSSVDSVLGQCWYFSQLMKLSIKHRYIHEYGELNINDRDGPEALENHLKQTSTGCLQENNLFIMGVTENKQVLLDSSKRWIATGDIQATLINSSLRVHQKENRGDQRGKQKSTESCVNYSGESKGDNNMSGQLTLQQSVTVASAFWKGCLLRKKLASALADVKSDELEDEYEEINVDAFTFSEAALEKEWLTLDSTRFPSKTLLLSNQLHWPKVTCHRNNLVFNPAVRLALFKNNENKHLSVKPPGKTQPINAEYFEENVIFCFMIVYILSHCFQASSVSREDMDLDLVSIASGSALTENREKNKPPHRHSARSSSKLWFFSISVLKITLKC